MTTIHWIGASGDWSTASDWSTDTVPGPSDKAVIAAPGSYTVTSSADETVDGLNILDKRATLFVTGPSTFSVANGGVNKGKITVDSGSTFNAGTTGGNTAFVNNSHIDLNAAAFVFTGDVSLEGKGKVTLSDDPNNSISGDSLSTNNLISGAGTISVTNLINQAGGTIDATGVNALDFPGYVYGSIENAGFLESTNPNNLSAVGGLEIDETKISNTPFGIIEANGPNTHVQLYHCYIVGGTLETRGANAVIYITSDGSAWDGTQPGDPVNIFGHVQFLGQTSLNLLGTINNAGLISLENSSGAGDWILISGNVTLEGGGAITLTNSPAFGEQNAIFGLGVLTNVDNVISGDGVIGNYLGSEGTGTFLINGAAGVVDANQSTPLFLQDRSFTNAGLMEATHNGTLVVNNSAIENFIGCANGRIDAAANSTISLEDAAITGGFVTVKHGGILEAEQGSNTIGGAALANHGTLEATNTNNLPTGGSLNFFSATITNTPKGIIEANGANTGVNVGALTTIVGGTLRTQGANAVIDLGTGAGSGGSAPILDGTQPHNPVNIEGNAEIVGQNSVKFAGTINNSGVITMEGGIFPWLICDGNVTLEGGGDITMTTPASLPFALAGSIFGGVLTNVDNLISGTGEIGQQLGGSGVGTFVNEAKGVIDADASTPLVIAGVGPDSNAGLMEATRDGTLLIESVTIDNFLHHAKGTVEAGHNSTVGLENATIAGGLVKVLSGAIIEADQGSNTITGAEAKNDGTIGAEGANLTIVGDVFNIKGDLDANNAKLVIDGAVKGGTATLEGTGEIEFGGSSSARVTFAANSDGILKLDAPSTFTGKVSGLTAGTYIDLPSIGFGAHTTLGYSENAAGTGGTLSITDGTHTADIALLGNYMASTFATASDGHGGTLITQAEQTATASQHLLTTPHSG